MIRRAIRRWLEKRDDELLAQYWLVESHLRLNRRSLQDMYRIPEYTLESLKVAHMYQVENLGYKEQLRKLKKRMSDRALSEIIQKELERESSRS